MKILVTATAGFIGFHLAKKLLECGRLKELGIFGAEALASQNTKMNSITYKKLIKECI